MGAWNLTILTTTGNDRAVWQQYFDLLDPSQKDMHFLPEYAEIYEETYHEKAFLALFGNDDDFVMMPFLLRDISVLPFLSGHNLPEAHFDIANPYGYGGPLSRLNHPENEEQLFKNFYSAFQDFCTREHIVTEFFSLHPLLKNHTCVQKYGPGTLVERKPVVFIDLRQDSETIWRNISRGHQSSINKARRNGIEIVQEPVGGEPLRIFRKIYDETMERNNAEKKWRFPDDYFSNCARYLGNDKISLFSAKYQGETVSSYLMIHAFNTVYYHFGGSLERYFSLKANNFLMYEIALWAKSRHYTWFHLGGGQRKDDPLFQYKAGFSKSTAWLFTYQQIHDTKCYEHLCALRDRWDQIHNVNGHNADFFPAYRR